METKTKINLSILVAGLVLLALIIVGFRSCDLYDKYSVLKGKYDALSEEYKAQRVKALADIEALRNNIAQKDEEIRNITSQIVEKEGEISSLHTQTGKLEEAYVALTDNEAKIDNLTQQVDAWKEKFSLAESVIADKDAIIFSLNEKYESQVKISLNWETLYNNEVKLHALCSQRLKLADKKLRGLRFTGTIKNGLILGLAGVVIYGLVRWGDYGLY